MVTSRPNRTGPLRILVVDDEPDIVESLAGLLNTYLRESMVSMAASGDEAIRMVETHPPFDLVITDYHMPGMDGVAFLQILHDMHPRTPSILFSGDPHGAADALARSPLAHVKLLYKPIEPHDLLDAVTRLAADRPLEATA